MKRKDRSSRCLGGSSEGEIPGAADDVGINGVALWLGHEVSLAAPTGSF